MRRSIINTGRRYVDRFESSRLAVVGHGGSQLSQSAREAINHELQSEDGEILISAISVWEIALLAVKGDLMLSMAIDDWLDTIEEIESVSLPP